MGSLRYARMWEPSGSDPSRYRVHLCFGPNCSPRGSRALLPVLEAAIRRHGLTGQIEVIAATCRNRCDDGPSMNVYPGPVFYNWLTPEAIEAIVEQHLLGNAPVERYRYSGPAVGRLTVRYR